LRSGTFVFTFLTVFKSVHVAFTTTITEVTTYSISTVIVPLILTLLTSLVTALAWIRLHKAMTLMEYLSRSGCKRSLAFTSAFIYIEEIVVVSATARVDKSFAMSFISVIMVALGVASTVPNARREDASVLSQ